MKGQQTGTSGMQGYAGGGGSGAGRYLSPQNYSFLGQYQPPQTYAYQPQAVVAPAPGPTLRPTIVPQILDQRKQDAASIAAADKAWQDQLQSNVGG
jgi:hypothetical protein